ncbi:MAG: hypothetical protein BWY74_01737 [Firmicutes bacterium ADurb.Bin419]|nr:MAG: hypothetical protein BWY74_01737 [Firmicutes bacterium ADurb.Bin419]
MNSEKKDNTYYEAKKNCNIVNRQLRKNDPTIKGLQIHEIEPIKLGGNPTDISNKAFLPREKHAKVVVWWNKKIREVRKKMEE